jgi:hypothetical protein
MHAVRRRLRLYAWLALLSIASLAVCPSVSRLLVPARDLQPSADTQAVATAALPGGTGAAHDHHHHHDGMMQAGMLPASSHAPSHQHSLEHCGFCVLAAHAVVVASVPAAVLAASDCGRQAFNARVLAVPRLRCDWSPASSRGPPLA